MAMQSSLYILIQSDDISVSLKVANKSQKNMCVKKSLNDMNIIAPIGKTYQTYIYQLDSSYILRRQQNFAKSSPYFCPM